jgi:hypothetical protein
MNTENLIKAAAYIRTVPQEKFDMSVWRDNRSERPENECNSVGCAVGHCTFLDPNIKSVAKRHERLFNGFNFWEWSLEFFDLGNNQWNWCFDYEWGEVDNTPEGAALRIEWLINHGLPDNWEKQMNGEEELCYTLKS